MLMSNKTSPRGKVERIEQPTHHLYTPPKVTTACVRSLAIIPQPAAQHAHTTIQGLALDGCNNHMKPGLDVQTRLVSDHYQESGQNGFDFAYRYPGFTRVLQTAGRLIRHELDKGIVILVDDRFKQSFYRGLYPDNWAIRMPESQHQLTKDIRDFWATLSG